MRFALFAKDYLLPPTGELAECHRSGMIDFAPLLWNYALSYVQTRGTNHLATPHRSFAHPEQRLWA